MSSHVTESKAVVVTGASAGIGRATAETLLEQGHRVALLDRNPTPIDEGERAQAFTVDVGEPDQITRVFERLGDWLGGPLDAVYHMAGIMAAQRSPIAEVDFETWQRVISVNLTGTFLVAKHAAPHLARPGGLLVLTSSQGGVLEPSGSLPYGASKAGIHGLVKTLERQLEPDGIRVVELVPGRVDTPLYRRSVAEAVAQTGDEAVGEQLLEGLTPPEAVGEIAAFLLTDAGRLLRNPVATV
ncbi:MAG: SDR family NAD(P)-dependent oxidoreductase [Acidimicrobiia bacterium]|nr:SDR family NAD(P)-dependent oxidoreductase [Acidimicrobiia bacterium]